MTRCSVSTVADLLAAVNDPGIRFIEVTAALHDVPAFRLAPSQVLHGSQGSGAALYFAPESDGVCLTTDNTVRDLGLYASPTRRALCNDDAASSMGTLLLSRLQISGQVQLLARNQVRGGHLVVEDINIEAADTRGAMERPRAYGVWALQGAFTLWNQQPDASVVLTCALRGIKAGRDSAPIRGSGILLCGSSDGGGRVQCEALITRAVYSDGGIAPGTADTISGGVFVGYGARVDLVRNLGPVTTFGPNDMALDNWGTVQRWIASEKVTTYGPSGIGFVLFGEVGLLRVKAPVETFGEGARGFNVYTGTVAKAEFDRIVTHGDGAVGVQIAQPVGELRFLRGIETFGAMGASLVKGVMQQLSAIALSVKPGGHVRKLTIFGGLQTNGNGVTPMEQLGFIDALHVEDGFAQKGTETH